MALPPGLAGRGRTKAPLKVPAALDGAALVVHEGREVRGAYGVREVRGGLVALAGGLALDGAALAREARGKVGQKMSSRGGLLPCVDGGVAPGARREGGFQVWDADSPLVAGQARGCLSAAT